MSTVPIRIVRRQDNGLVDAVLHTELSPKVLVETETEWGPIRREAARKLLIAGRIAEVPQHFHWDWERKSQKLELLAYRCFGVECAGKFQGLLLVKLVGVEARVEPDKGKPLVYVEYLESAPWNLSTMVDTPLYGGIGPVLMQTAVRLSYDEGFHGRIGLHALPQSEKFYRDACEMHGCGPDGSYHDLPYYEMTREIAARFVANSSGGAV
jgi:hypothetical protein